MGTLEHCAEKLIFVEAYLGLNCVFIEQQHCCFLGTSKAFGLGEGVLAVTGIFTVGDDSGTKVKFRASKGASGVNGDFGS